MANATRVSSALTGAVSVAEVRVTFRSGAALERQRHGLLCRRTAVGTLRPPITSGVLKIL
jgi:hypothetical protein